MKITIKPMEHSVISETELEDVHLSLRESGYNADDFDIWDTVDPLPAQGIGAITGTVTIKNERTGISQTYAAGHRTSWPAAFDQDVKAGVFG